MKIIYSNPPNHAQICKVFEVRGSKSVVFTYGDTIYNPGGGEISNDLYAHEKVHMKQQGDDPATWWAKYLVDKKFRLDQEVEAYRKQWRYFVEHNYNTKARGSLLNKIASDLAGPIYGNIVDLKGAIKLITEK